MSSVILHIIEEEKCNYFLSDVLFKQRNIRFHFWRASFTTDADCCYNRIQRSTAKRFATGLLFSSDHKKKPIFQTTGQLFCDRKAEIMKYCPGITELLIKYDFSDVYYFGWVNWNRLNGGKYYLIPPSHSFDRLQLKYEEVIRISCHDNKIIR